MNCETPAEPGCVACTPLSLAVQEPARGRNAEPDLTAEKENFHDAVLVSTETSRCFLTKSKPIYVYLNNKMTLKMSKFKHFDFSNFFRFISCLFFFLLTFSVPQCED